MNLEKLLLDLLETGLFKTSAQVIEEFRAEYPGKWRELEEEGRRLFGSGCGVYRMPATRIAQALFDLSGEVVICRLRHNGYEWSKRNQ